MAYDTKSSSIIFFLSPFGDLFPVSSFSFQYPTTGAGAEADKKREGVFLVYLIQKIHLFGIPGLIGEDLLGDFYEQSQVCLQ